MYKTRQISQEENIPKQKNYVGSRIYHYVYEQAIFMLYFTSKGLRLTLNSFKLGFTTCLHTEIWFAFSSGRYHPQQGVGMRWVKVPSNTNPSGILCPGDSLQVHLLGPFERSTSLVRLKELILHSTSSCLYFISSPAKNKLDPEYQGK